VKLHALVEAESKSVLSYSLTDPNVADTVEFPKLVYAVQAKIMEIYADAGYLSAKNCWTAAIVGATPYIRPKRPNRRPAKALSPFQKMLTAYLDDPQSWLTKYHVRSGVESTFAAIKRRLGDGLAAATRLMLRIEAILHLLAWNLTRVRY
jgi:transposase